MPKDNDLKKISAGLSVNKDKQKLLLDSSPLIRKLFNIRKKDIKNNDNRMKISFSKLDIAGKEVALSIRPIHKDRNYEYLYVLPSSIKDTTIKILDSSSGNEITVRQNKVMHEDKVTECNFVFCATKVVAEVNLGGRLYIISDFQESLNTK